MTKITVKSCEFKQEVVSDKGNFKVYTVTDIDGKKYDGFEEYTEGDHDVEIMPNSNAAYNDKIKKIKAVTAKQGFPQKDYKFEKRKLSLEIAKEIRIDGRPSIDLTQLLTAAEKIETWLNR